MNTATATENDDRIELFLTNAAWQLARRAVSHARMAVFAFWRDVLETLEDQRRVAEERRAVATLARMSCHYLRDLGIRRDDLPLLASGTATVRREV